MTKRKIVITEDGSTTVFDNRVKQNFHSVYGALSESQHIFIKAGFEFFAELNPDEIRIFEVGFGTGLNAALAMEAAHKHRIPVLYHTVEKYPLENEEWQNLSFGLKTVNERELIEKLHTTDRNREIAISDFFTLKKQKIDLLDIELPEAFYDVVFFDAFSPDVQPELWTKEVFSGIFKAVRTNGVLTTYSVKGDVKRALKAAGFKIEKIPGPKGKREILRAVKP